MDNREFPCRPKVRFCENLHLNLSPNVSDICHSADGEGSS